MIAGVSFSVAAASYVASVTLGVLVATRLVDSSGFHWVHHALYIVTFVLAASTVLVLALTGRPVAAALLGPALLPFAAIPFLGTRGARHPIAGSVPAPFYIAAAIALAHG